MSSQYPKYLVFDLRGAVDTLLDRYPSLTDRDIDSITEQVVWSFTEANTLMIHDPPDLEIERLPDSYGIIRDESMCSPLRLAFCEYYETIRMTLLLFGMEEIYIKENIGYIYDRFISKHNKLVLKHL